MEATATSEDAVKDKTRKRARKVETPPLTPGAFRQGSRRQFLDPYSTLPIVSVQEVAVAPVVSGLQEGTLTHHVLNNDSGSQKPTINIPAPESKTSQTFENEVDGNFKLPSAFIRHRVKENEDITFLEYELTEEDMNWREKYLNKELTEAVVDDLSEDSLEMMINVLEKATANNIPISLQNAMQLFSKHLGLLSKSSNSKHQITKSKDAIKVNKMVEVIYQYWIQKRSKLKKPLLRRFWPITATNDSSPHLVFRPREKERYKLRKKRGNDKESYQKLTQLLKDFTVVHMLMELVKRREQLSRRRCVLELEKFEQSVADLAGIPKVGSAVENEKLQGPLDVDISEVEMLLSTASEENNGPTDEKVRRKKKRKKLEDAGDVLQSIWGIAPVPEAPVDTPVVAPVEKRDIEKNRRLYQPFVKPLQHKRVFTVDKRPFNAPVIPTAPRAFMPVKGIQKYRWRSRIGRGGRFLIDRVPAQYVHGANKDPMHMYATPHPLQSKQEFIDPASKQNMSYDKLKLTVAQRSKLEIIFRQDDSEDEELIALSTDKLASPKSTKPKKTDEKKSNGPIIKQRVAKFKLLIN